MPPESPEPITAGRAAERLGKRPGTIRSWATRYAARKLGAVKGRTVYDWHDLKTIARCLHLGEPVPATPEDRDRVRASFSTAA